MPKNSFLPAGISIATHKRADGSIVERYRLRIRTKKLKINKIFDTENEARDYLIKLDDKDFVEGLVNKTSSYDDLINTINADAENPNFNTIYHKYIEEILVKKDDRETSKLSLKSIKSRLLKLLQADIVISSNIGYLKNIRNKETIKLKDMRLKDFTEKSVKELIKFEIAQKKKKSTIQRELTELDKMIKEFCYYKDYDYKSPVRDADKLLLKKMNAPKRVRYIEASEEQYIKDSLKAQKNKQMADIILLSIFTSLRRSEVLDLKWSNVFENYVLIPDAKNGHPREVYLTAEAKAVIDNIQKVEGQDKLFTYTIEGFKTAWQRFRATLKIKRVTFHDFRKAFITNTVQKQIEQSGIANVFALATAMGIKDKDHLNKEYVEREQQKYNNNHRKDFIDTEKDLMLNSAHKDYRTASIYTTKLKIK